jgi:transcriptional regulator with XRE-family HTH domain
MMAKIGREVYHERHAQAMELAQKGMKVADIAERLGVSYSAAYHWVKGIRVPEKGNIKGFEAMLRERGPLPAADVMEKFPKHNEIFLTGQRRGIPFRRYVLSKPRAFGPLATWYYLEGQEAMLKERIMKMLKK